MIAIKQTKNLNGAKKLTFTCCEIVNVLSWHSKDTKYFELSPYHLKTDGFEENFAYPNVIFENYWQGSKVYPIVYDNEVYPHYTFRNRKEYLWWEYKCIDGKEKHFDNNTILPEYYKWRDSLWSCKNPVRYPNTIHHKSEVLFSVGYKCINNIWYEYRYDYINARITIYFKEYVRLIRKLPIYHTLLNKIKNGINILITEVDVPSKNKRGLYSNVDNNGLYYPTLESLKLLIYDKSEAFGHGLCLAQALLEDSKI